MSLESVTMVTKGRMRTSVGDGGGLEIIPSLEEMSVVGVREGGGGID